MFVFTDESCIGDCVKCLLVHELLVTVVYRNLTNWQVTVEAEERVKAFYNFKCHATRICFAKIERFSRFHLYEISSMGVIVVLHNVWQPLGI